VLTLMHFFGKSVEIKDARLAKATTESKEKTDLFVTEPFIQNSEIPSVDVLTLGKRKASGQIA
jgi:hypothetical protein